MKKSAFSLLELAVVLIIIGILTAAIAKGGAMIKSSRIAGARAVTTNSEVAKIDGLLAWWETSLQQSILPAETVEGASLTSWFDISPASISLQKNVLTKTASSNVTYVSDGINNIPSLRFSGSGRFEIGSLYQGATSPITLFIVFRPETTTSGANLTLFDAASGNDDFALVLQSGDLTLRAGNSASLDTNFINGQNYISAAYFNLDSSAAYTSDADNIFGGSVVNSGSNSLNGVSVGTDKAGNSGFIGLISEVIIYNRPLKINERKDVLRYLVKKYKINISGI